MSDLYRQIYGERRSADVVMEYIVANPGLHRGAIAKALPHVSVCNALRALESKGRIVRSRDDMGHIVYIPTEGSR